MDGLNRDRRSRLADEPLQRARLRQAAEPANRWPTDPMFVPISIDDYVQKHIAANAGVDREDLTQRLRYALRAARAGARCACGGPIWVIGSAEAGLSCFTCITGEAAPDHDYEIAEAIDV